MSAEKSYDVVGVGNAMVDILARVPDAFLAEAGVEKGIMQLIDADRAVALYAMMGPAREVSGGSAANTIAGLGQPRGLCRQGQGRPAGRDLRP
jgi:sugar/nucleoside kinase (ribokinase family)